MPTVTVEPCLLPCWCGIVPGETSAEQALLVLRSIPGVYDLEQRPSVEGSRIYWYRGASKTYWYFERSPDLVPARSSLVVEGGIVTGIVLDLPISESLTLGEVVERYGPPEGYEADYVNALETEPDYWLVILYYPQKGFIVVVMERAIRAWRLTPDLQVTGIRTFPPTTMEGFFASVGYPYPDPNLREWQGFGRLLPP